MKDSSKKARARKKVCNECPFRKSSPNGWLGPHTVDDILSMMQYETPFACHKEITDDTTNQDIQEGKVSLCRGMILSANASCKLFGQDPVFGKLLRAVQNTVTEKNTEILNRNEFKIHHTIKPKNQNA